MPNKKITVVGDGAEQPLTPEEEHRLELKVDQMMDPEILDTGSASADEAEGTYFPVTDAAPQKTAPEPAEVPVVDSIPPPPAVPELKPEKISDPDTAAAAKPEPKKVTKIVTKFADDETIAPAPAEEPAAVPAAPIETPKPKPAVKKIAITHHSDEDEAPEEKEAPKPKEEKPKKPTKTAAAKTKAKKAPAKKTKSKDANLESQADAITAAALAAAEQLQAKKAADEPAEEVTPPEGPTIEPSAEAGPDPAEAAPEPATAAKPAEAVPDLPTAGAVDDSAQGAPPLIQKHSAAPIGAALSQESSEPEPVAVPTVGKKINIVDNSGDDPEATPSDDETTEDTVEAADAEAAEPTEATLADTSDTDAADDALDVTPADSEEPLPEDEVVNTEAPAETDSEPEAVPDEPADAETEEPAPEEPKKYRPPDGPIQFKRAEKPIEPYKPGTGPRPPEPDDLSSEDAAIAQAFETKEAPRPKLEIGKAVGRGAKKLLTALIVLVVLAVIAAVAVPSVRNRAMALVGATSDVTVTVLDASTDTPLAGADVSSGSSKGITGADGTVTLHGVRLGSRQISIRKYAFTTKTQAVDVAWHSQNPSKVALTTSGQHYKFTVVDYLSGKPVSDANISSGPATTVSDAKGEATLVAPTGNPGVKVTADGYTPATVTASTAEAVTAKLFAGGYDVYVARSGGKFNVYRNTVDGRQEQVLLSDAGASVADLAIAPNASGSFSALVSKRDGTQNSLTLVRAPDGKTAVLDHADNIKLVDWFGSRLVYVLSKTTTGTTDANRYRIVSYDTATKQRSVIDHAAYLNDVMSAGGTVYYATAANGSTPGQFIGISPNGKGKKVILPTEIASITRNSYSQLTLSGVDKWYTYQLGSAKANPSPTAPSTADRHYVDNANGSLSVYVDSSGSTPILMLFDVKTGKETQLIQAAGITYPVHWLGNNTIIYRVSHGGVVTDNAISSAGGNGKVITNVSDIAGIALWHE